MRKAAEYIVGEHDFKSFCSNRTQVENTVRCVHSLDIEKKDDVIYITISGNGFLYNMVRIIVGTLIDLGRGKLTLNDIKNLLVSTNRQGAGKTVSPDGLYLKKVEY